MTNCQNITMTLDSWRGFSAYEIAVQNGYAGTEAEWLESLKGSDGKTTSVNGVSQHNGQIVLTGADICVSAEDIRRLNEVVARLDELLDAITLTEDGIDLGGRYIDNALFR